jgi:hypothetical protein
MISYNFDEVPQNFLNAMDTSFLQPPINDFTVLDNEPSSTWPSQSIDCLSFSQHNFLVSKANPQTDPMTMLEEYDNHQHIVGQPRWFFESPPSG